MPFAPRFTVTNLITAKTTASQRAQGLNASHHVRCSRPPVARVEKLRADNGHAA